MLQHYVEHHQQLAQAGRQRRRWRLACVKGQRAPSPAPSPSQRGRGAKERVGTIADARHALTGFGYDPNGNLLSVTDAKNQTTTYTYDTMDRLATRWDALNRTESYGYDLNGNLSAFTDRKNQTAMGTYDDLNRRVGAIYTDGSSTTFTYDAVGRLARIGDSVGAIEFGYDILSRLTLETTPLGSIQYAYDALGRRTAMTVAGQAQVTYQYDAASRLTRLQYGDLMVTMDYDAAGRRTALTYPNGTNTSYAYDAASRVTSIVHQSPVGAFEAVAYTYDAVGNRLSVNRANGPAAALPAAVTAAGYDAANQQIQVSTANLTYDANGNLVNDGALTHTWDARNRLISRIGPGINESYAYDALGRRISKTVNSVTTQFLYDGNDIVAEMQGGTVTAVYLRGLNIDEPFIRISATSNEYYYTDALGSVLALTNDAGQVTTTYAYEPFGKTTMTGTSANPFQYMGRENDGTGLYYYRSRYYHPQLQRFLSEDSLKFGGGDINLYAYVGNNPLRYRDPLGFFWEEMGLLLRGYGWNTHQQAIDKAVGIVNPKDPSNYVYDPNYPAVRNPETGQERAEAVTTDGNSVTRVGDAAFSLWNPGWLVTTIGHESIHRDYNGGEVCAYKWELDNLDRTGLDTWYHYSSKKEIMRRHAKAIARFGNDQTCPP